MPRLYRSKSQGEGELTSLLQGPWEGKPMPKTQTPPLIKSMDLEAPKSIFTIGSPPRFDKEKVAAAAPQQLILGEFLKTCWFCKNKINENQDIYMAGSLRAFCTPRCRDRQILLDEAREKASAGN